jgi:hypothetical protein
MLFFSDLIEEGTSTIRRNIASKRAAFAGASAMAICKKKNPGLYKMYEKHNTMRKQIKERIQRQYGPMARSLARQRRF